MKKLFLASSISDSANAIAKQIGVKGLKAASIITASEPEDRDASWIIEDKKAMKKAGFYTEEFTFTGKNANEVQDFLEKCDIIMVRGGNTFYLLDKMRESGADKIITSLVNRGKIYIGSSAGSIVAGPDIYPARLDDDMSLAPNLTDYKGLNLVDFVVLPHWGSEFFRVAYENESMEHTYNKEHKFILLNDYQYVTVVDDMYKIEEIPH